MAALSALLAAVLAYSAFVTGATVGGAGGGVGVDEAKAMDAGEDSGETLGGRTSGRNSLGKMRPSLNPACMCTYDVSHARNEWCFIGCTRHSSFGLPGALRGSGLVRGLAQVMACLGRSSQRTARKGRTAEVGACGPWHNKHTSTNMNKEKVGPGGLYTRYTQCCSCGSLPSGWCRSGSVRATNHDC